MKTLATTILTVASVLVFSSSPAAQDFDHMLPDSVRAVLRGMIDKGEELFWHETRQSVDSAAHLFDSARVLDRRYFGDADTLSLDAQLWQARCYYWQGDMDISDSLVTDAAQICDRHYGHEDPVTVAHSWPLSVLHWVQGRDDLAIPECLRALRILEQSPEYSDQYGEALNALAMFYYNQNRWDEVDSLRRMQLELSQKLYGPDSRQVANVYISMAWSAWVKRNMAEAEVLTLKAQDILRNAGDQLANCEVYSVLARIHQRRGNLVEAERLQREQLRIAEQALGPRHWLLPQRIRELLTVLSETANTREDWQEIELLADRAASMCTPWFHARYQFLQNLRCVAFAINGQYDKSLAAFNETIRARRELTGHAFSYASERMKLQLAGIHPTIISQFISFVDLYPTPEAKRDALLMILKGRARVLDAVAAERTFAFCSSDKEVTGLVDQLTDISGKMSSLFLAGGSQSYIRRVKDSIATLQRAQERLETELSEQCAEFRKQIERSDFSVSSIASALPKKGALLEYIQYYPYTFAPAPNTRNHGRRAYGVFVLDPDSDVSIINLGDAAAVDSLVAACRNNLQRAGQNIYSGGEKAVTDELSRITRQLYETVFAPIESLLVGRDQIFICPDGQLSLIPFDILATQDDRYLIEKYKISYVSSGRNLLEYTHPVDSYARKALVMANPDYDQATYLPVGRRLAYIPTDSALMQTRGPESGADCLAELFGPLPGTSAEGELVAQLLAQDSGCVVESFYGRDANELQLKSLDYCPWVIHVATHGYFCPQASFSDAGGLTENPLLYSGLALAGANQTIAHEDSDSTTSGMDDGILTSLEVSGLDLSGTELVVLSSCNSGVGTLKQDPEGMYGLRRAFQLAGARSIVSSMFSVPDLATASLMAEFYGNWLSGKPKSEALRTAALNILNQRRNTLGFAHPIYWGGFVLYGDPN